MALSSSRRTRIFCWAAPCLAALTLAVATGPRAEEAATPLRRVDFQVERSREVDNDRITAVMRVELENAEPAALADAINKTMKWALDKARASEGLSVRTGAYHTQPIREQRRIRAWRATQDLILDGEDTAQVSALIGELQERLQVASIAFRVSDERQRTVADELIQEALRGFRERAALIRDGLDATRYAIVHLSVHTGGIQPPPRPQLGRVSMMAAESVAPPALEGGSSSLNVSISATIQLD